jgi:phosphoglycerate dehydrogenase-like enzyme
MPSDAVFINTSRGFVVDNMALAQYLRSHSGAQAHLDVHEPEPFDQDYPLLTLPNAKLYPHLASRTSTAVRNMSLVVRDVIAVLNGEQPQYPAPAHF